MTTENKCDCLSRGPAFTTCERKEIGVGEDYEEISLLTCKACGSRWLRWFWEHEAFTASGRLYVGYLGDAEVPAADDATTVINTLTPRFRWSSPERVWMLHTHLVKAGF